MEKSMSRRTELVPRRGNSPRPSFFLILFFFIPLMSFSDPVSKPNDFSSGTIISASQINANFDILYNLVDGNIDAGGRGNGVDQNEQIGVDFTRMRSDFCDGILDAR